MPSTYTVNLGIEKPATGEQSGTWGDTTNVNFDIIDQAVNGSVRVTLTSAGTSGSPNDLNIVNGSTTGSEGRNKWIEIYSASDLGGSAYVRLVPNDAEKILFIRNSLAGSQSVLLFQGTYNASNDLEIPAGVDMVVKFDGAGASATVTDVFTKLRATEITTPTLTAGTADINGGSVDGATVGAASASTGAFTTLTASTSLNIASSTTVDGVLDEDNMASDSATKLATQQSIKAYVDSQVGTVDTWAEVLANGATSGATNPEIDSGQALKTNTINETTAGSGVTIDSVLLKDDSVNAATLEVTTLKANDGTAAGSIADSTGVVTLTSVDINGGNIDGTTIGATSTANGNFSTVNATDVETSTISANDGTTAINIADTTGAVDIDTSLNVDGVVTSDGLTVDTAIATSTASFRATSNSTTIGQKIGSLDFYNGTTNDAGTIEVRRASGGNAYSDMALMASANGNLTNQLLLSTNGDITFYDGANTSFVYDADSGLTINNNGAARDFTVKSDNKGNMLYVDGTNDILGIGTTDNRGFVNIETSAVNYSVGVFSAPHISLQALSQPDDNDGWVGITYATSDSDNYGWSAGAERTVSGVGDFVFTRHSNSETGDERVRFTNGGYVGIGGSPAQMLDLFANNNGAAENNTLRFTDTDTATQSGQNSGTIEFYTSDTDAAGVHATIFAEATGTGGSGAIVAKSGAAGSLVENIRMRGDYIVINDGNANTDFQVKSQNQDYTLFVDAATDKVGIGGTNSPDALLHLWTQNSGSGTGGASGNADELLLENNSNCGLTILTENLASIHFGKEADNDIGKITYNMSTNDMLFTTNTAGNMTLRSDGDLSLSSSKHLNFNDKADMTAATQTTSTTAQTAIYSFSATTYTGAKLLVCVTDSTATERYITELLVTHDGTTAVSTEYGQVATDTALATFDVDISGGNVRLLATPASSNSMTFKVMSTQLLA